MCQDRYKDMHNTASQAVQAADPECLARYEALLSPDEALQLAAAPTAALRRERLLARTLTRTVLGRYCHPICGCVPRVSMIARTPSRGGTEQKQWLGIQ